MIDPGPPVEADHHLGVRPVAEIVNRSPLPTDTIQIDVEFDGSQRGERDREHDRVMCARHNARGRLECELDTAAGGFADRSKFHAELDGAWQRLGQSRDDAIVAVENVVPLIAEDPERGEFRAPVCVDVTQEVQAALLLGLEAELGDIGGANCRICDRASGPPGAVCAVEILRETRAIERHISVGVFERGRLVRHPAQINVHHPDEVAELIDDRRFRDELTSQVVEDIARLLRDIFQREIEPFRVTQHRLMGRVDEFTAALGDLTRELIPQRYAAPAHTRACFVHRGRDAAGGERIGACEPRNACTHHADVDRRDRGGGEEPLCRREY